MPKPSVGSLTRTLMRHPVYMGNLLRQKYGFLMRRRWFAANHARWDAVPEPLVYKFLLTLDCNLRCERCMEWGDTGWCKSAGDGQYRGDLDWTILRDTINDVSGRRPSFIFSGGEPLLYGRFGELCRLMKSKKCSAIVCTNGTLLDRHVEDIEGNPYVSYLVSLDGLRDENDRLRGAGVYDKVVGNIRRLKSLRNPPYVGLQFTVMPENVGVIYDFCREAVNLGVDWVLLNPCWFITPEEAGEYEAYMRENFGIEPVTHKGYLRPYQADVEEFGRQMERVEGERWPMQISCYFKSPGKDMRRYVGGDGRPRDGAVCFKQWLRADVTNSGRVAPCIQFPDLVFGDLRSQTVSEVWNSKEYADFRRTICKRNMPLCEKCNNSYLYDTTRRHL